MEEGEKTDLVLRKISSSKTKAEQATVNAGFIVIFDKRKGNERLYFQSKFRRMK